MANPIDFHVGLIVKLLSIVCMNCVKKYEYLNISMFNVDRPMGPMFLTLDLQNTGGLCTFPCT